MVGQKYIPQFINVDLHPSLLGPDCATFIKNIVYSIEDTSSANIGKDSRAGVMKTMESTAVYVENFKLPDGYNQAIGALDVKELRQVFVFVYNDRRNHTIYRINGNNATIDIVKQGACLDFELSPEFFIHQGGAYLEVLNVADPVTGLEIIRTFLFWTNGINYQGFVCVEDSIATSGFDPIKFPYFTGDYDQCVLFRMGIPTPKECLTVKEVPRTDADKGLNNNLLFNTWQFRLMVIDVWGRPSEHGIISNMYIPGVNDCIGASAGLPRCLDLIFKAPNPTIDKIQVEYRNCNDEQWYISDTIFLYTGSSLGEWWKRSRNPDVSLDPDGNITYTFCRDRECQPVATTETARVTNPLPRSSQAISKIGSFVGLFNNKDGFPPFPKELIDKISITVEPPAAVQTNTASITIYVGIWNEARDNYQAVFAAPSNYLWGDNNSKHGGAAAYSQYFINPQQHGFGGYLVGTGNYVIATQVYVDANGELQDDTNYAGIAISPSRKCFQKFVFTNIPKGNYIFRLFSHLTDPATNGNYAQTSTTVWGLCPFSATGFAIQPEARQPLQEILINVCNGDYNTLKDNKILMIADLAAVGDNDVPGQLQPITGINSSTQAYKATCGYWYETNKNGYNQYPIELIKVTLQSGISSLITDHNGFYYFSTRGTNRRCSFNFTYKCAIRQVTQMEGNTGMRFSNHILDQDNFNNTYNFPDYYTLPCNRILIKGKVVLSGTNIPVANVVVVITRGQFAITDSNGEYTIVAHDDNTNNDVRNDQLILASGTCVYTNQTGGCIPTKPIQILPCSNCVLREVDESDLVLSFISGRGLLSGGTYGVSVIGKDWLGRPTFAQPIKYITIPSITQSKAVSPSKVRIDIDPTAIFPEETDHITFAITPETTIEAYDDWIVDSVLFVDNTGVENDVAPTQIKIYYASLIEFNKQNNYNTTVNWSFLEPPASVGATQTPYMHDVVYFYINGDGNYFPNSISALVKYDQAGQYFLIDYTSDLAGLLPNALIRLVRPKGCTGTEGYFEVCDIVNIVGRSALLKSFYLDAFDTYYLYRQIPVPLFINPTKTSTVSQTIQQITNADGSKTTITQTTDQTLTQINEPRTFGFPFESDSPSNFWGKGCHNQGRPFVKNPFEAVLYHKDQWALSGAISSNGVLNYLNYFDDNNKGDFNDSKLNGIVSVMIETSIVLVIGQTDNFVVGFSDNLARANADGSVSVDSINNQFGRPQGKVGSNYGCNLFDKNTIYKYKGIVNFLDSNESAIIQHNFSSADPFTESGANSAIGIKIKEVQKYNNANGSTRYFTSVINPSSNEYILTDKIIKNTQFVNQLRYFDHTQQETFGFGIFSKKFRTTWGFLPECYARLDGDVYSKQMFSFVNGIPHRHYDNFGNTGYGKIYGQTVNRTLKIVCALDNLKKKKFLSLAVYCKEGTYFSNHIITETGQKSRIMLGYFYEAEFGFYAAFLADSTNPNPNSILDGEVLNGTWAEVSLVGDPSIDAVYSELQGIVINVIPSEKSGV